MNRFIRRAAMAALLVSAATAPLVMTQEPSYAAQARNNTKGQTADVTQARRQIGVPLNDAVKAMDKKDFAVAMAKVQEADKVQNKTPLEEYLVAKYMGFIAINQPMQDLKLATASYNRMMASGGCPDGEKLGMYGLVLRLNYQAGDYDKVIQAGAELQKMNALDDTAYQVLTQSYYDKMDWPNAVKSAQAANQALVAAGKKPSSDLLGLQLNAQAKSNDPGYRQTLDQLATVSNQPEVWGQVMDFALATQGISDHQLLNVFRLALRVGTMRDVDYPAMATIDVANGISVEGKEVLEKAIAAGTIMRTGVVASLLTQANGLIPAETKSLPELATEAGKQANGEIYVKLGESYWANKQYDKAIDALQKGIAKGGLKDAADAQTMLGIVLLDAGKKDEALQAFQKGEAANGTGTNVAHVWSLYLRRASAA